MLNRSLAGRLFLVVVRLGVGLLVFMPVLSAVSSMELRNCRPFFVKFYDPG